MPGVGDQPVGHLLLQHQRGVAKEPAVIRGVQQLEQDRRRDVVGKVADDANGWAFVAQQIGEIRRRGSPPARRGRSGRRAGSAAARSRSISTATTRPTLGASGDVSAPRPGPISRNVSSGRGVERVDELRDPGRLRGSAGRIACALALSPVDGPLNPPPRAPASRRASSALRSLRSLPRSGRSSGRPRGSAFRRSRRASRLRPRSLPRSASERA